LNVARASQKANGYATYLSRVFNLWENPFSTDLAIDLGTANTLIYVRGKGIVLDEPSVVAIRQEGGPNGKKTIQAVGLARQADARPHAGQHHGHPADEGRRDRRLHRHRADAQAVHQEGARLQWFSPSPRIIICVPCGSTQVERRAIRESALGAGASRGVPDRGADGRGDRRRTCRSPRRPARWWSTSAAAPPKSA
jgi:rod shape-determining protein MreB